MIVYDSRHRPVELAETIGHGGEAIVYRVAKQPEHLAKIYQPEPRPNYNGKLDWMVKHPPENPTRSLEHESLAWPGGLLFDSKRKLQGYWMPFIQQTVPMVDVFNPRRRAAVLPQFDRRYLLRTARNLAAALSALHRSGYVAGDLNESNVLVTPTALVTLIDTDSFQVREQRGGDTVVHPCPVGKPEYTPPELQRKALSEVVRQSDHDAFGLAVLIFQLLMEGSHPFRAQWLAAGDPPPIEERIANGAYPYVEKPAFPVLPPQNALRIETLHPSLVELFRRTFVDGHRDPRYRPGTDLWVRALSDAEKALVLCADGHYYASHLTSCPYCALTAQRAAASQAAKQQGARGTASKAQSSKAAHSTWAVPSFAAAQPSGAGAAAGAQSGRGGAGARSTNPFANRFSVPVAARARAIGINLKTASSPAAASSSAPSWRTGLPISSIGGVLHSQRAPVTTASVVQGAKQAIYKSLVVGGGQGALAGLVPGLIIGLAGWFTGEPLYWTLLFLLGGVAGGLVRGWRPGHKLASVIDRTIGWKYFWNGLGLLLGALAGGAIGMMFAVAIFPVFLGMVLGAQAGAYGGQKVWQAGSSVGWERIFAVVSALAFGSLGYGAAYLAGILGMNDFGASLASGLLPFAENGSYMWAFIWAMAGGMGGALAGALGGLFTDLVSRISRLIN